MSWVVWELGNLGAVEWVGDAVMSWNIVLRAVLIVQLLLTIDGWISMYRLKVLPKLPHGHEELMSATVASRVTYSEATADSIEFMQKRFKKAGSIAISMMNILFHIRVY